MRYRIGYYSIQHHAGDQLHVRTLQYLGNIISGGVKGKTVGTIGHWVQCRYRNRVSA